MKETLNQMLDKKVAKKMLNDLDVAFDFNTITPEEWKAWIYEYHPEPKRLAQYEEEGDFI